MAIARVSARCLTCSNPIVLRIGLAPVPEMKTIFSCPHCRVALRLQVDDRAESPRFASEDVALEPDEEPGAPVVVVYTDLPVPLELTNAQTVVSPFLVMASLWGERATEYTQRSHELQRSRGHTFPVIRRAASLYGGGNLSALPQALVAIPGLDELPGAADAHPVYLLSRAVDTLHIPFVDFRLRAAAGNEFMTWMVNANDEHPAEYRQLLHAMRDELGFAEHRRKVVETAMTAIENGDALLPGLAWEHITADPQPDPNDFRIMRGDFNELRTRYVEIFELASRSLAFIGAIANVAARGAANLWADGTNPQIRTMLSRTAQDREFILDEFPLARAFYDAVHRSSRNAFGHYNIEYDVSTGELVDRDGSRTSFVLFMVDYLAAAR